MTATLYSQLAGAEVFSRHLDDILTEIDMNLTPDDPPSEIVVTPELWRAWRMRHEEQFSTAGDTFRGIPLVVAPQNEPLTHGGKLLPVVAQLIWRDGERWIRRLHLVTLEETS